MSEPDRAWAVRQSGFLSREGSLGFVDHPLEASTGFGRPPCRRLLIPIARDRCVRGNAFCPQPFEEQRIVSFSKGKCGAWLTGFRNALEHEPCSRYLPVCQQLPAVSQ